MPYKTMPLSRTRRPRRSHHQRPRPAAELLEPRTLFATLTWVGDVDANWGTRVNGNSNWSGNALPQNGDILVFNATAQRFASNTNDIAGLSLNSIRLDDVGPGGDGF